MKGKQKTQTKKQTQDKTDGVDGDALQKEIEKYLKITEENKKYEEVDPKEEEALKVLQDERQNQFKGLIEQKDVENTFEKTLQLIKEKAEKDLLESEFRINIDLLTKKNKELAESTNLLSRKYSEFEIYNKNLLEKIKELNEEKKQIELDETEKRKEIEKKCEEFKKDVKEKFTGNFPEIDKLKEDNVFLQTKLDEYRENTEKIRDNILAQLKLRDEATMEAEKKTKDELKEKMGEVEKGNGGLKDENRKLAYEVGNLRNDANQKIARIQKIGKDFDTKKKEFEKLILELQMAIKENRDLKEKNVAKTYEDIKAEHERIKGQLDEITDNNRKLHEKLKILKEQSDKIKENKN